MEDEVVLAAVSHKLSKSSARQNKHGPLVWEQTQGCECWPSTALHIPAQASTWAFTPLGELKVNEVRVSSARFKKSHVFYVAASLQKPGTEGEDKRFQRDLLKLSWLSDSGRKPKTSLKGDLNITSKPSAWSFSQVGFHFLLLRPFAKHNTETQAIAVEPKLFFHWRSHSSEIFLRSNAVGKALCSPRFMVEWALWLTGRLDS